ncbi:MAG TPA: hypothetical protein VLE03_03825 [Nitrospiraceae bacterium]|nr:hypothetical protein [Nitrospiraceae bacterium]
MDRQVVRRLLLAAVTAVWVILPLENRAEVTVLPEVSMTVDGRAIRDHAAVVAHPTVQDILAAFRRAEDAVQKQDLEPLLQFYAKGYNYHGLKPADVRRIWGEVFTHYSKVTSTHLISEVKLFKSGSQLRAEITCTGGLYGTEPQGGTRVTLDSWFREVHYLVYEEGAWRFLGNAGAAPSTAPFTSSPHHPLF